MYNENKIQFNNYSFKVLIFKKFFNYIRGDRTKDYKMKNTTLRKMKVLRRKEQE